ncbi:MAG: hypothetical protein AAB426_14810 [Myxococcota bacterium]
MSTEENEEEEEGSESARSGILPDGLRKVLVTGLSAVFMTEEGIRGVLGDMRLPKDAMAYLAQQAERTRRELYRAVTQELQRFFESVDLTQELRKALRGMKLEVRAEVRFSDAGEPTTRWSADVGEQSASAGAESKSRRRKAKQHREPQGGAGDLA